MDKRLIILLFSSVLILSGCIQNGEREIFNIRIPSEGAGVDGSLAVRIIAPPSGMERYKEGAPVVVYVQGGYEVKGIGNNLPLHTNDIIIVTFIYPGGTDPWSNLSSDGNYDWRGDNCIKALRDVILFCAGEIKDVEQRSIDDIVDADVLHDNIGLIGLSNGGNILVAVSALYGDELNGHLKYIIQWETPVNSQIACRDLGRVLLNYNSGVRGDFENPWYQGFNYPYLDVNYSNLAYNEEIDMFQIFHDGNGDGMYTTIENQYGIQTPDINNNEIIDLDEDYPVGNYSDGTKFIFSRAITKGLENYDVFSGQWPSHIANVTEAENYWDIRESVVMFNKSIENIPNLEVMILASVDDHVQIEQTKPHIRLAFEGWFSANINWVKINPDKPFFVEVDPRLKIRNDLPKTSPNKPPSNWTDHGQYCYPEDIFDGIVELAAIYEMADRVYY